MTNGSSIPIKLPTVSVNNTSPSDLALKLQTEQLIDPDAKTTTQQIINTVSTVSTANQLTINTNTEPAITKPVIEATIEALVREESKYQIIKSNLKYEYDYNKTKYGSNSTEANTSYEAYKNSIKQIDVIQTQILDLMKKLN